MQQTLVYRLCARWHRSLVFSAPWPSYYSSFGMGRSEDFFWIQLLNSFLWYTLHLFVNKDICPVLWNSFFWYIHTVPCQPKQLSYSDRCCECQMKCYFEPFILTRIDCLHQHFRSPDFTLLSFILRQCRICCRILVHHIPLYRLKQLLSTLCIWWTVAAVISLSPSGFLELFTAGIFRRSV